MRYHVCSAITLSGDSSRQEARYLSAQSQIYVRCRGSSDKAGEYTNYEAMIKLFEGLQVFVSTNRTDYLD